MSFNASNICANHARLAIWTIARVVVSHVVKMPLEELT